MKVLVVDDDSIILSAIEGVLIKEGLECVTTDDGNEAIEMACANDSDIDLIITDIMMPFISGIEIISNISENRPDLPIITISALDQREVLLTAVRLGADDFVRKPVNMEELTIRVFKCLKHFETPAV